MTFMIITKESSWDAIPNGTVVELLGISIKDAYKSKEHYLRNQKFTKMKKFLTLKARGNFPEIEKGDELQFGLGIKIKYEKRDTDIK
jgi:hypothetical protein